ncbi:MAG: hypothetical protein ACOVLC_02200 [Flavobacterium sp.]
MSNLKQNPSPRISFHQDNTVIDFLSAIEHDFELSKDAFASVYDAIPNSNVKNSTPRNFHRRKKAFLSVLKIW